MINHDYSIGLAGEGSSRLLVLRGAAAFLGDKGH